MQDADDLTQATPACTRTSGNSPTIAPAACVKESRRDSHRLIRFNLLNTTDRLNRINTSNRLASSEINVQLTCRGAPISGRQVRSPRGTTVGSRHSCRHSSIRGRCPYGATRGQVAHGRQRSRRRHGHGSAPNGCDRHAGRATPALTIVMTAGCRPGAAGPSSPLYADGEAALPRWSVAAPILLRTGTARTGVVKSAIHPEAAESVRKNVTALRVGSSAHRHALVLYVIG